MTDLLAALPSRHDGTIDPDLIDDAVRPYLVRDVDALAPAMRDAVNRALVRCDAHGHTVFVLETYRSDDVEAAYFRKGRDARGTVVRADEIVTNSPDGAHCQHCYHAAVDIQGANAQVAAIFAGCGLSWGGNWRTIKDYPHFYWSKMPPSPSVQDVVDYRAGRIGNVWLRYALGA